MRCSKCGAENPEGKKFCGDCGAALENRCPQCGAENSPGKRFCGDCGAALAAGGASAPPAPPAQMAVAIGHSDILASADGERRHLTVLFSDLVGSTEIAAHLDAEDWREIAAQYQRTAGAAVTRFGGHVAKYLGDGLMVYFGWPEAHEDDAERAVRAGLAIVDEVAALNGRLAAEHKVKLAVRVGIQTGSVVIGQGGGEGSDVFGDAPNVASRVQSAAEPDSVLITAAVHELVAGLFEVEDRGAHPLKGIEHPLQLYRAIQPTVVRPHTQRAESRSLTPFVGREDDMRLLLSRWERAREGQGQLVLVMGEPGIGKSRVVEEFRTCIKDDRHFWVECAGEQLAQGTPFHAVTDILEQGLAWRGDESSEERVVQLERRLDRAGLKLAEAVPLIAEMLGLPVPDKYPAPMFAPEQKRKRLLANLAGWVLNVSHLQPTVVAMEDLHWIDPSTLELTQMLVEQAATAPLLLLCTARPEFRVPWSLRAHHAQITLNRLNDRQTREMVAGVVARAAMAQDLIDAVVKRTDGVPLFAEELTRLILEHEGRSVVREIPATLHDSLTARLDRLGPVKEVAQLAAVIGREFSYELLHAVAATGERELQSALLKLADAELIYARGIAPEATYRFKHALIQDAAYEALLKSRRREMHRRVAQTIAEKFPNVAEVQPEAIARHWTGAGETEPAIAAWRKAADSAYGRRGFDEAVDGYRQALAMLSTLPESRERDTREIELANALFRTLSITRGYAAPETVAAAARARALAEKSGNVAGLVQQLFATRAGVFVSGDYSAAAALSDQLLDLAEREGGHVSLGFAYTAQVDKCFYCGNLVALEEHFKRWDECRQAPGYRRFPGAIAFTMGHASVGAWVSGRADLARSRIAQAVTLAREDKSAFDLAAARAMESWLYLFLREPRHAEVAAAEAIALSDEHGFPFCRNLTCGVMGWAQAQRACADDGIALIRQGLAALLASGARIAMTAILSHLAEAQALGGRSSDALDTINKALEANPGELLYRPHVLTCRAELRLKLGEVTGADSDLRQAIELAQKMSAKAWELRATTSLARLLRDTNRRDEARTMLAEVYNWFIEGFDTADLKEAKALLDELSVSP